MQSPVDMSPEAVNVVREAVKACRCPDGNDQRQCNQALIINIFFPGEVIIKQECENDSLPV